VVNPQAPESGAGAPEVTPAMIEAGHSVFQEMGFDWDTWTPEFGKRLLTDIFRRMKAAS
jgi:hypothetical protein